MASHKYSPYPSLAHPIYPIQASNLVPWVVTSIAPIQSCYAVVREHPLTLSWSRFRRWPRLIAESASSCWSTASASTTTTTFSRPSLTSQSRVRVQLLVQGSRCSSWKPGGRRTRAIRWRMSSIRRILSAPPHPVGRLLLLEKNVDQMSNHKVAIAATF